MKKQPLVAAVSYALATEQHSPVLTNYKLATVIFDLFLRNQESGALRVSKQLPTTTDLKRVKDGLLAGGVISESPDLGVGAVRYMARPYFQYRQIVCGIDPFAYISHLSAMVHYGLTDQLPKMVFATTYPTKEWSQRALQQMQRDLGDSFDLYVSTSLPSLRRIHIKSVQGMPLNLHTSLSAGSFIIMRDEQFRVASIGRTFLDMLRRPDLCGGMVHVMDVFEEHAKRYLPHIVSEVDAHGSAIEKVRAGYILDECCGLQHEVLSSWRSHAQRGGSRKLDPTAEYVPEFSENWAISLNVYR